MILDDIVVSNTRSVFGYLVLWEKKAEIENSLNVAIEYGGWH